MALKDYYNTGDDAAEFIYCIGEGDFVQVCQSFKASENYSITGIKLKLYKDVSTGTIIVNLKEVDVDGFPAGEVLAVGTTDGSTLTESEEGEWREIIFESPYSLSSVLSYGIIVSVQEGGTCYWKQDVTSPTYSDGKATINPGTGWSNYGTSVDCMFETYGIRFRNVENAGVWLRGGTYTFEVYFGGGQIDYPEGNMMNPYTGLCSLMGQFKNVGFDLYTDGDVLLEDECGNIDSHIYPGNFLFDNNSANFIGGVEGLLILGDPEDLGNGWWKYTVSVSNDLVPGTYYLKGRDFDENGAIV